VVWVFKWNLVNSTFTWYYMYLYLSFSQNEIWDFSWIFLILGTLGSERDNYSTASWFLKSWRLKMTGLGQCCYGKAYLLPKAFSYKYRPILDKIKMELQCFTDELDSACKTNQVISALHLLIHCTSGDYQRYLQL